MRRAVPAVLHSLPEELPVAMVFEGSTQGIMMATPQDIEDFAMGFALSEGNVRHLGEIREFESAEHSGGIEARIWLPPERAAALKARRRAMMGPVGCGLCGIDSLDQALRPLPVLASGGPEFSADEVARAADELRSHQPLHDQTHSTHAAGFLLPGQGIVMAREGRWTPQCAGQAGRGAGPRQNGTGVRRLCADQPSFGRDGAENRDGRRPLRKDTGDFAGSLNLQLSERSALQ